jgi:hypothetical protein
MTMDEVQMAFPTASSEPPRAFFAYPSHRHTLSETIREAAAEINKNGVVHVRTWQEMSVTGKNIVQEICREINEAQIFCADLTGLNPNVLFELGYAIARDKRIWPVFDTSFPELRNRFDQLQLLTTTGFAKYTNSDDIVRAFLGEKPYLDIENTVFRQFIQPSLSPQSDDILVYLKSQLDTNAGIRISKFLGDSDVPVVVDDPSEMGVQTLTWYGQKVYSSVAVVAHLLGPGRDGSEITNAKHSLVSGLAYGFGRPLLMLAEPDHNSPLDYRDLLFKYKTATEAVSHLRNWFEPIGRAYKEKAVRRDQYSGSLRLKVELRDFYVQIGEFLAENETNTLENYYIETTAYREALAGTRRIFVGRKGTGKTANLAALASELRGEKDNVVCIVQPIGYEIESLVRLFNLYRDRDTKGHVIESLWKFLLLTEIANATAAEIEGRPLWAQQTDAEKRVLELLDQDEGVLKGDFSIRLEHCVSALLSTEQSKSIEQQRKGVSEALHETAVKTLRAALDDVLSQKKRVAILVDNLDRAWVKQADIAQLSEFLLGLFNATNQLLIDLARRDSRRQAVNCTAAIFLRSDIFYKVVELAREPDKLAVTRLAWDDIGMLSQVVEKRFLAAHKETTNGDELWTRYFCPTVRGMPTKDYVVSRILPRPRDVVYLVKGAISTAVNRGHSRIEEDDVLRAEYAYSEFAMDSIMVENSITLPQLERVLYEFAGAPVIVAEPQVRGFLHTAKIPEGQQAAVLQHLIGLSFLGMEVGPDHFVFSDEPKESKKHLVLADKLAKERGTRRYMIHYAFRSYLEVLER